MRGGQRDKLSVTDVCLWLVSNSKINRGLKRKYTQRGRKMKYKGTRCSSLRSQPLRLQTGIYFTDKDAHFTHSKKREAIITGMQEIMREINN